MLIWAGVLLVLTIIFGYFAFKKRSKSGSPAAKILFFIALVLFIVALVFGLLQMFFHPDVRVSLQSPLIP